MTASGFLRALSHKVSGKLGRAAVIDGPSISSDRGLAKENDQVKNQWMYVAMMAVLLSLTTVASANTITSTILGFSSTTPITYSPGSAFLGGSGSGTLTTPAGSLPIGTAVNFEIYTINMGFYSATTSGPAVTQNFVGLESLEVNLASDGSVVLVGYSEYPGSGYATGVLGSSSATIDFSVGTLGSMYINNLPDFAFVTLTGTTSAPLSLDYSLCPSVCPSISSFDLDWNLSVSSTPSNPAPEPSSLALLGAGLLGIATYCEVRSKMCDAAEN